MPGHWRSRRLGLTVTVDPHVTTPTHSGDKKYLSSSLLSWSPHVNIYMEPISLSLFLSLRIPKLNLVSAEVHIHNAQTKGTQHKSMEFSLNGSEFQ